MSSISRRRSFWRRLLANPVGIVGLVIIVLCLLGAVFAPQLSTGDPEKTSYDVLLPPLSGYLLGTDAVGRDVFARLLYGLRTSLLIGCSTAVVAVAIGMVVGAVAGYFGGNVDYVICAAIDLALSFPVLVLALLVAAFIRVTPPSLALLLGGLSWMRVARLVRSSFLALREREFVVAARACGVPNARIITVHILPNSMAPIIVAGTVLVAEAILMESALSYLGFGIQPPTATLGNMLQGAQQYFVIAPWQPVFPGLLISLVIIGINFLGDGLREVLDPRLMN